MPFIPYTEPTSGFIPYTEPPLAKTQEEIDAEKPALGWSFWYLLTSLFTSASVFGVPNNISLTPRPAVPVVLYSNLPSLVQ